MCVCVLNVLLSPAYSFTLSPFSFNNQHFDFTFTNLCFSRVLTRMLHGCPPPQGSLPYQADTLPHTGSTHSIRSTQGHTQAGLGPSKTQTAGTQSHTQTVAGQGVTNAMGIQGQSQAANEQGLTQADQGRMSACCMPRTLRLLPSYQHLMHCSIRCVCVQECDLYVCVCVCV